MDQQACPDLPALSQKSILGIYIYTYTFSGVKLNLTRTLIGCYGRVAIAKSKNTQLTQERLLDAKFDCSSVRNVQ